MRSRTTMSAAPNVCRFVAIGHVDTGKSSLCGHLLQKCGYLSEHEMKKIREKARRDKALTHIWSRVLDVYQEEQERGKTREFAKVCFTYQDQPYELIDTPGHQGFIRSTIQGMSESDTDICVVLLSALDSDFHSSMNGGTLKELLTLARCVGFRQLVLVVNKMDGVNWRADVFHDRVKQVKEFAVRQLHWPGAQIWAVPVSAYEGIGLIDTQGSPAWCASSTSFLELLQKCHQRNKSSSVVASTSTNTTPATGERLQVDFRVLHLGPSDIFCAGFQCVMHHGSQEIELEVCKIHKRRLLRVKEQSRCILQARERVTLTPGDRLIFRKDDYTLGFGKLLRVSGDVTTA